MEHDNRGYVDYLQWSGAGPIEEEEEEPEWQTVSYTYDPAGRRIEKKVDGTTQVKYVYDGDHILAEYNGSRHAACESTSTAPASISRSA